MRILIAAACFSFLVLLSCNSQAQEISTTGCPTGNERVESSGKSVEQEILRLVNEERKKRRLKPLKWDENLAHAARYHAYDMLKDNYTEHDTYDRKGGRLKRKCDSFDRIAKFIDDDMFARAENLAFGELSAKEVVRMWMKSKGHRQNILDREAKFLGVGYVKDADSEWTEYFVQCFGM